MKHLLAGIIIAGVLAAAAAQTTVTVTAIVTSPGLNLRESPSRTGTRICVIPQGGRMQVIGDPDAAWIQVVYDGKTGYVSAQYVTFERTAAREPPSPGLIPSLAPLTWVDLVLSAGWVTILIMTLVREARAHSLGQALILGILGAVAVGAIMGRMEPVRAPFAGMRAVDPWPEQPELQVFMGDIEEIYSGHPVMDPDWYVNTAANAVVFMMGVCFGAIAGSLSGLLGSGVALLLWGPAAGYSFILSCVFASVIGYAGGLFFYDNHDSFRSVLVTLVFGTTATSFAVYFWLGGYVDTIKEVVGFFVYREPVPWARLGWTVLKLVSLGVLSLVENVVQLGYLILFFGPGMVLTIALTAVGIPLSRGLKAVAKIAPANVTPFDQWIQWVRKKVGTKLRNITLFLLQTAGLLALAAGVYTLWTRALPWHWAIKAGLTVAAVGLGKPLLGGVVHTLFSRNL